MVRQTLSLVLITLLACGQAISSQAGVAKKRNIKEQVLALAAGSPVEVRLLNKQKIRGRMGELSDQGFQVQYLEGEKLELRSVGFDEVKSIKAVQHESKGGHVALGILAGIGITFVVLIAIAAAIAHD